MNSGLAAFVSGVLFAVGLALSGMTQPGKVAAFLNIFGYWDPSLAFVMMGAIVIHVILYRVIRQRPTPLFAAAFSVPTRTDLDARLISGAALFGVGWGVGGFCPGPAVTSLIAGHPSVLIFVAAMIAGMILYQLIDTTWLQPSSITMHQEPRTLTPSSPALQGSQDA